MYKYKQTTDVEVGDLVVWTDISKYHGTLTKDKVYQVTNHPDQNTLNVINDKGNKNSYGKGFGFKVLQTKPADQAVVGDYMYRISSATPQFPPHSVIKITEIRSGHLYYKAGHSVLHNEVIVITQAEPEVKYPLFMQSVEHENVLVKFIANTKGTCMLNGTFEAGHYSSLWESHQSESWKPCDFTIEPDIFDIGWWQARYEAGLPVYVKDGSGDVYECKLTTPRSWGKDCTFGMTDPLLVQQVPTIPESAISFALYPSGAPSKPTQTTIKEQPMKLQQLLDTIFGVSDYEAKPKFIVTVFNNDKEVATTTAESVEEIQQTIQSDTRLWGCKLVAYKIHSELQTQVPVAITKFKKESNASAE